MRRAGRTRRPRRQPDAGRRPATPPTEDEQGPGTAEPAAPEPTERVTLLNPTVGPPTPSPEPTPEASAKAPAEPEVEDGPFAMNLFRKGDFVPQYTFEWCVGASLQMMRNLTDAKVTRSRTTQQKYWEMARDLSSSPFGGANPRGWTAVLNELGYGPYKLVSIPKYKHALRVAACRDAGDRASRRAGHVEGPPRLGHERVHVRCRSTRRR